MSNDWLFSMNDICKYTPSLSDSFPLKEELVKRAKGVNFIIANGNQLRLPPMTIYAAAVFFHRFYMRFTLKQHHYYEIAAACLFLATKVEESNRRLKDIAIACTKIASKDLKKVVDEQSKDYWKWRDTIIYNEELLLEALCFDLTLKSPYEICSGLMKKYEVEKVETVRKSAQRFIHDSCKTILGLVYTADEIAAAAFYWAIKSSGVKIDLNDKSDNNLLLGVKRQSVYDTLNLMSDFFTTLQESPLLNERKDKYPKFKASSSKRKASLTTTQNEDDEPSQPKRPKPSSPDPTNGSSTP